MYLFFDTETNGLPKAGVWPRITQLAFLTTDPRGNELTKFSQVISPGVDRAGKPIWTVPKEEFFIENNISTERCLKEGIPLHIALRTFQNTLKTIDHKVAHNISFDNNVIINEMKRIQMETALFQYKKGFCTMHSTTQYCKLPGKYGKYKWPKLIELHNILFACDFEGAHDAFDDVRALKKCFFELKRIGIIKI